MAKSKVFISHISQETGLAQILKKHLSEDFLKSLDIFVSSDGKTIQAGTNWLEAVTAALENAKIEIVLCSKNSVGRPWVNFEAGAGWIRGIPVIPICHSGMEPYDLPVPLNMLQAIKANEPESLQELYEAVAREIDMAVPEVDFKAIADEIVELEQRYKQTAGTLKIIDKPSVLCAASEPYAVDSSLDFDLDVAILEKAFPQQVTVERKLTSKRLRNLLGSKRFDIIHLVLPVEPINGELIFGPVVTSQATRGVAVPRQFATGRIDRMPAAAFAALVRDAQTSLVFLAMCHAYALAIDVSRVTNIIATNIELTGQQAVEWEECFYDFLANGTSLFKAYENTILHCTTPFRLIERLDVAFNRQR